MSMKEMKALYESLLESGDLEWLLPNAIGEWKLDKKGFEREYNKNSDFLTNDDDINDELFLSEDGF